MKRKTTPRLAELAAAKKVSVVGGNSKQQQQQEKEKVIEIHDDDSSEYESDTSANLLEDDDNDNNNDEKQQKEQDKPTKRSFSLSQALDHNDSKPAAVAVASSGFSDSSDDDDDDDIVVLDKKSSSRVATCKKEPTATNNNHSNPELVDLMSSEDEEEDEDETPTKLAADPPAPPHVRSSSFEEDSGPLANAPSAPPKKKIMTTTKTDSTTRGVVLEKLQPPQQVISKDDNSSSSDDVVQEEDEEDEDENDDEEAPPTTEQLQHSCWTCHVPLQQQQQQQQSSTTQPKEFCCYAMHTHPLLQVPACCVCSEQVAAVEQEQEDHHYSNAKATATATTTMDPERCSGCGLHEDDVDLLFLCDKKNDCHRAMCGTCVAQAHGGGRQGQRAVRQLLVDNGNDNDDWHCPICQAPAKLQTLQEHLKHIQIQLSGDNAPKRSLKDILQELQVVEQKKQQECNGTAQKVESVRQEIRRELMEAQHDIGDGQDKDEIEELVREGVEEWQEFVDLHEQRLSDMVSSLHDELELNHHDIDLKKWYQSMGYIISKGSSEEPEPLWKQEADKDIDIREHQEKKRQEESTTTKKKQHNPIYDLDVPQDIEDLGSLSDDEKEMNSDDNSEEQRTSQWRHCQDRATKESIEKALKIEDEELAKIHVKVESRVEDKDDILEIQKEERTTGGRVRRDHVQHVQIRRKKQQQQRQSNNSGKSDNQDKKQTAYRPQPNVDTTESKPAASLPKPAPSRPRPVASRRKPAIMEETKEDLECIFVDDYEHLDQVAHKVALSRDGGFSESSFVLSNSDDGDCPKQRFLSIAEPLAKILKPHQKEGIEFMFRNVFADLCFFDKAEAEAAKQQTGGCILAHNMGLGKSLSTISLLHALFSHPSLRPNEAENRQIHTVLLVAPVNTIANWENEFEKWTGKLKRPLRVDNLNNTDISARGTVLRRWAKRGGVLLVSEATFTATLKKDADNAQYFQDPGPDAIVLDEAHSMLKNRNNVVFKALNGVTTRRRICLTGSPYQNNLFEYFRMIGYIRPGVLGKSEGTFERQYVNPIADGIASDASEKAKALADDKLSEIQQKLEPYVNRKDASVLLEDLPPMQQVVLHLRQTKLQARLYGAFKKHQKKGDGDFQNFLKTYHELRPIHNHPGCLLLRARAAAGSDISNTKRAAVPPKTAETIANGNDTKAAEKPQDTSTEAGINEKPEAAEAKVETLDHPGATAVSIKAEQRAPDPTEVIELLSDSDIEMDEDEVVQKSDEEDGQVQIPEEGKATPAKLSQSEKYDDDPEEEWYARIARRYGAEKMNQIENGNKVVMLLHILVHASILDEKVVLFTQCLKTLDFIQAVLALEDWQEHVPSLASSFPNCKAGGWKSGRDFLRIDGAVTGAERGSLVNEFNEDLNKVKIFLISSRAGGIGINLCSANRVVLFDSTFNPTVMSQALFRCYRYGQTRSVFAYRFLTEGTMEEKVYSRAVNKTGLSLRVIDGKAMHRCFSAKEVEDLNRQIDWVQCDKCEKWRTFPPYANVDMDALPEMWFCELNKWDKRNNNCDAPERDQAWYESHFADSEEATNLLDTPMKAEQVTTDPVKPISKKKTEKLVARDVILQKLLNISARDKTSAIVSKHYFHEALLNDEPEEEKKDDETSSSSQLAIQSTPPPSTKSDSARNGSLKKKALASPAKSGNGPAVISSIQGKTLSSPISETSRKPSAQKPSPSTSILDLTRSPASETPKKRSSRAADPEKEVLAKRELVMPQGDKSKQSKIQWLSTKRCSRSDDDTIPTGGEESLSTKKRSRSESEDGASIPAPLKRKMTASKSIVKKKNKNRKSAIQAK